MCKLYLLVACLACAGDGRRLQSAVDQDFSSQDVKSQKLMEQMNTSAGSSSHGQANWRKIAPLLLTFFNPAAGFASSSNGLALNNPIYANTGVAPNSWIYSKTQAPISSNPIVVCAGPRVMMMDHDHVKEAPTESGGPTVRAVISVDWEGRDLRIENLHAFENFREAHPEVPLTHFLNAAYFTKSEEQLINEWMPHEALSLIDEQGLHVHGLKSLVESSGVRFLSEPDYVLTPEQVKKTVKLEKEIRKEIEEREKEPKWLKTTRALVLPESEAKLDKLYEELKSNLSRDEGMYTDIRAYSVDELQAIISNSKAILERQGFTVGESFRAGAWLAGPNVLEAIRREDFLVNSSAVGFDQMIGELSDNPSTDEKVFNWRDKPLAGMLRELWPDITNESQPFLVETPAGQILEMPDTGGMADYATVEDMVDHIDKAVQQLDSGDRFVHLGFHQETAAEHAPKIIAAITEIKRKHGDRVVFETLKASAQRALSSKRLKNEQRVMQDS